MSALHQGIPVVVFTDTPLVHFADLDGVIVDSDPKTAVERFAAQPTLLRMNTCPHPALLRARQQQFLRRMRDYIVGQPQTAVRFYRRQKLGQQRATGYRVRAIRDFGIVPTFDAGTPHEFVLLGGRIAPETIDSIETDKPIVLAMNDAIDCAERINWFRAVAARCALMFVADPPELLPDVPCPVVQLHSPPNGSMRRISSMTSPHIGVNTRAVVFLANHWYPRRKQLVAYLAKHVPVIAYGATAEEIPNVEHRPPVRGDQAWEVSRRATVALSSSSRADREITSNRLFTSAAAGACVLAEEFPNCRTLYPDDAVAWFADPDDAVEKAKALLDADTLEMRFRAQEITWRRHSAHNRMEMILYGIQKHLGITTCL
jgi:hypothetical protein